MLFIRQAIGKTLQVLQPNSSYCKRCFMPYSATEPHVTITRGDNIGYFPLCVNCWSELTPEKRIPFYQKAVSNIANGYMTSGEIDLAEQVLGIEWQEVKNAVMRGK